MATVTVEEAQAKLTELIEKLKPGEEATITRNQQPVAKLVGQRGQAKSFRQPGSARGRLVVHAEDEEHLADFKEYMP